MNPGWRAAPPNATLPPSLLPEGGPVKAEPPPTPPPDLGMNGMPGFGMRSVSAYSTPAGPPSNAADTITPEIQRLSDGFNRDLDAMFLWVRNNIRYSHYYGCRKGAALTLWEKSGNDADQCALLAALVRAAGYTATYEYAVHLIPAAGDPGGYDLSHWLGIDATNSTVLAEAMSYYGAPSGSWGPYEGHPGNYLMYRYSLKVSVTTYNPFLGSFFTVSYLMDPSMKPFDDVAATADVTALSGYNRNDLLTAAGGTVGTSSIKSLNETSLTGYLNTGAQNVSGNLTTAQRNAPAGEVFGSRKIRSQLIIYDPNVITYSGLYYFPSTLLESPLLPDGTLGNAISDVSIFSTVRFQLSDTVGGTPTLDVTLPIAELQGKRLSLYFEPFGGWGRIWLDDTVLVAESPPGSATTASLKISITHQGDHSADQTETKTYLRSGAYAITYGFSAGADLLQTRLNKLSEYKRNGLADSSREVVTENLNVIGLSWLRQTELAAQAIDQAANVVRVPSHRFGRVSQETSFYVDVGLQFESLLRRTGTQSSADTLTVLNAQSFVWSAMEHGVLAQMQAALEGVSTVKLVSLNNAAALETYLATNANWKTGFNVRSHLTGYSASDLALLDAALPVGGSGGIALLPKNGHITKNQWHGAGYVVQTITETNATSILMGISGGLSGGYNSEPAQVVSYAPLEEYYTNPVVVAPAAPANRVSGGDPVNLVTGHFTYDSPSTLSIDSRPLPRGLSFGMSYDGARSTSKDAGVGYGWDFNLNASLTRRSDTEGAIATGTPEQVAAAALGAAVIVDLCKNLNTAKDWTVATLAAKWFVDRLTDNAYSLTLNGNAYQFPKLPNGGFGHPTGNTLSLQEGSGTNYVKERNGSTYAFNAAGRLATVTDLWGKQAVFTYDTAEPTHLTQVKDAYNRVFNFTWSGDTMTAVTDPQSSPARSVNIEHYDATSDIAGCVGITDPEGKSVGMGYEVSSSHYLGFLRSRAVDAFIVDNFSSDDLHRVTEQWMTGDPPTTPRVWKYFYAPGVTRVKGPTGAITAYYFDELNRPVARVDPTGQARFSVFDGQNHVTSMTSATGAVQTTAYDDNQNVVSTTDRYGQTTYYTYDGWQRLQTVTDPRGHTVTYTYNSHHQVTKISQTVGGQLIEVNNSYSDYNGNLLSTTDADGNTTSYSYDAFDRLQTTTLPGGATISVTYSAAGDPVTVTNALGHATTMTYTKCREPLSTSTQATTVDGAAQVISTSRIYDADHNVQTETDARGHTVTHTYSPTAQHLTATLQGETVPIITSTYNSRDLLEKTTNAVGAQSSIFYDENERPVRLLSPLNQQVLTSYDADGRPLTTTDALSRIATTAYDDVLRTVTTTDPLGRTRQVHSDANGNVDSRTDARGNVWTTVYDELNRPKQTTTPEGRVTTRTWNKRGLPASVTTPSTNQATFTYDARGRFQQQAGPDYTAATTYDANSNPLTVTETTGSGSQALTRTYDEVNRVKTFTNEAGETLKYLWDQNGNLLRLTYPDDKTVTYTYDNRNRLTKVVDWASRITTFDWDAAGRLTQITRPNGTLRKLTYDLASRTTKVEERLANNRVISVEVLGYDDGDRLLSHKVVPLPGPWAEPSNTATYDKDNRLLTFNGAAVSSDADGNLLGSPLPEGAATFTWDSRNRLTSATRTDNSQSATYGYDAEGRLNLVTAGTQSTRFTINPHGTPLSQVLVRTDTATHEKTYCVYGLGLLYEERPDGSLRYYHYDQLGSTVALTDAAGKITGRVFYTPYGEKISPYGDILSTPFLYNGRYGVMTDKVTGLLHMRARFYNPRLKRFLNPDPSGFAGGWNAFAYADGNPVSFVDPFGLSAAAGNEDGFWSDYVEGVKDYWSGFGSAVAGVATPILHPIDTANGLINAAEHPIAAAQAIGGAISNNLQAIANGDNRAAGEFMGTIWTAVATAGAGEYLKGAQAAQVVEKADEVVNLYRAVSPEEFADVFKTGKFRPAPDGASLVGKQFGHDLDEIIKLADHFPDAAAVIKAKIPKSVFDQLDHTPVDSFILRSGSTTVQPGVLDLFNRSILELSHAF